MVDSTEVSAVEAEHTEDAPVAVETVTEAPAVEAEPAVEVVEAAPVATASTDRVSVRHPDGVGCSFAGHSFEPDADGAISVPAFAVADLSAHGFVPVA